MSNYQIQVTRPLYDGCDGICGETRDLEPYTYMSYDWACVVATRMSHEDLHTTVIHAPSGKPVSALFPYAPDTGYMTDGPGDKDYIPF